MELYEGQIVRVRTDLVPDEYYGRTYFNELMTRYCGKIYRVADVWDNSTRCYFEHDNRWIWNAAMLEPVVFEEGDTKVVLKAPLFGVGKVGDIITVKEYEGEYYLTKEHLPMQGMLSAIEAEIIKEDN